MILKLAYIKFLLLILLLTGIVQQGFTQSPYNLVPNYSFESYSVCCSVGNSGADYWGGATIKANIQYSYSNVCCTNVNGGVPSNCFGESWQYARTGNGYISIGTSANNGSSLRNYAQTKLINTLKANKCYYIEFWVSLFNNSTFANNNISLLIGDTAIQTYNNKYAPANPQIQLYENPCISDTLNWVQVAGVYTAHGGEQYITIGNFKDDAHTDTLRIGGNYISAYYIDDVSVIPLDSMQLKADAGRDTTIVKGDSIWIGSRLCGLTNVVWYDAANNVIDTGAPGLWVKPTSNTFYVIEQNVCGQYSRDTVYITVAALPVIIDNYKLIIDNGIQNTVENIWVTASEVNVIHFNVQRSEDGLLFNTVGKVNAKGASKYSFIDNSNLTGELYYRLQIVDKNGALSYSEIKQLIIDNGQLIMSPNPAKDYITISGINIKDVRICDASGRVLLTSKDKKIDIRSLVSGVYYIAIETINGNHVIQKFIKLL